jgi:hypothetical protein
MPIKLVDSPVNRMKCPAPAPNKPSLKTTNPKRASPYAEQGPKAPASSTPVELPTAQ